MLALVEQGGLGAWVAPWANGTGMQLRSEGIPYSGNNQLWLSLVAYDKGYESPYWFGYGSARDIAEKHSGKGNGGVRRGEHGTVILAPVTKTVEEEDGKKRTFLVGYREIKVFNAAQIDGLPEKYYVKPAGLNPDERREAGEAYLANLGADVRHGGAAAYYVPSKDYIQLPPFETFASADSYYVTAAHETAHWAEHDKRLGDLVVKRYGGPNRAFTEIQAELAGAMIAARLGIAPEVGAESAQYVAFFVAAAREDPGIIIKIAGDAQKIADHNLALVERNKGATDRRAESLFENTRAVEPNHDGSLEALAADWAAAAELQRWDEDGGARRF